ncbi:uncharacterized protein YbaR (Trm112 family) [Rhodoligotrophos appendicifer]|uniref:class I SAM-dependent methyltransferase n=1 Tax=Rhodoligotrophos appendicifer TaxID=987056 RepID=UPI00118633A6|nr:class I SAM-dependent methyltransferase [Rhodoligotrophos appendicifer]
MLATPSECMALLRCPKTGYPLRRSNDKLVASSLETDPQPEYPIIEDIPVLIDFQNSVLTADDVIVNAAASVVERPRYSGVTAHIKRLLSPHKSSTRTNVRRLITELEENPNPSSVLIVGGGSIGQGMQPIYDHPRLTVYSFDIYRSKLTQFIADAHQIPMPESSVDAVVVQAVLEHVLQPQMVVDQIWRVLKPRGLVYSETPFMQQVHEGAFDFTRFTESGHRYLFRDFECLASGASGGPGLQFMWSMDYLVRSLFRSERAGKVAKLLFFWAQYLDRLVPPSYAVDGASGVFFLGRKSLTRLQPSEIIPYYRGAQTTQGRENL